MIYNMDQALKDLLKKYYVQELETQLNLLYDQYESFPVAEAAKPGDQPLEKQLLQKNGRDGQSQALQYAGACDDPTPGSQARGRGQTRGGRRSSGERRSC
jgi:hypothetical protein